MKAVCGACGGAGTSPLYVTRGQLYLRCTSCGSGRLADPPGDPSLLYTEDYFNAGANGGYRSYDADAHLHGWTAKRRLNRLARWMPHGPYRLLDVGCASGYVLAEAQRRGWQAVGVEVSAAARERARQRGLTVEPTVASALARFSRPVTAVTYFQVLEHLVDPVGGLAAALQKAETGTVVCVETWDLRSWTARLFGSRWQQANPPSVAHLFTRRGLTAMASRVGLRVLRISVTPKPVSVGLVSGVAADAWPTLGGGLQRALNTAHLNGVPVPYVLDDLITLIAVREA